MAKGISISIASETREFTKGVQSGVIAPLEDAADSLDDFANAGEDAGKELEKGFEKARHEVSDFKRDQQDAGRDLEKTNRESRRSFETLADVVRRESDTAGRTMKKNYREASKDAGEGFNDLKQEAKQNAEEVASSFDGSFDSIRDGAQGLAATAFSGFGPAGTAAGLLAAAGLGVVGTVLDQNAEKAEQMSERTNTAFDEMIEAGGRFLSSEVEAQKIRDTLQNPQQRKDILSIAELTGIAEKDVTRAIALNGEERTKVLAKLKEMAPLNEAISQTDAEAYAIGQLQNAEIAKQVSKLEELKTIQGEAVDLAKLYDEATGGALAKRQEEIDAIRDRNKGLALTPTEVSTRLVVDDSDLKRKLVAQSLDVVINAVTRFGSSAP